ncbi:MAG: hypothetical protein ACYC3K_05985 [Candidatus Nanopelagicales bacterium]
MSATEIEAHHRLRGGVPQHAIRALKNDYGTDHAPMQSFLGNWPYWHAVALAHDVAPWLRTLALPAGYRRLQSFVTAPDRLRALPAFG